MGAFNMLILEDGNHVQFKFGFRRQLEYHLGDRIEFAEDKTGEHGRYEVSGIGGTPGSYTFYALTFEDGVIAAVRQIGEAEFEQLHEAGRELRERK